MTKETMAYMRDKVNNAQYILKEINDIDRACEVINSSEFSYIGMEFGEGSERVRFAFYGDRAALKKVLDDRLKELHRQFDEL